MQKTLEKLPERCFAIIHDHAVLIKRGVPGKYLLDTKYGAISPEMVDQLNKDLGVTAAQQQAMLIGSMFGWDIPGADPDAYDNEGRLLSDKVSEIAARQ